MAFTIEELNVKNGSEAEQIRTRKIFEVLKQKAIDNQEMTEHEKDFFCLSIKHSMKDDGTWETYSCCDNHKFKFTYLMYARDTSGVKNIDIYKPIRTTKYKVPKIERENDLKYLREKANEWENVINTTNHAQELLQQSTKESREELRELDRQSEFSNNIQGKFSAKYVAKKRAIILFSKWIYCTALEIFEALDSSDFISEINATKIEFNEYSLIHILNRHYAKALKQFNTKKSFHSQIFEPRILSKQLKELITIIDDSKLLQGKSIDKICFRVNHIDYIIYTSEKSKSLKGKGEVIYRRLNTFFPIEEKIELNKLKANYDLRKINNNLSVYVPN